MVMAICRSLDVVGGEPKRTGKADRQGMTGRSRRSVWIDLQPGGRERKGGGGDAVMW